LLYFLLLLAGAGLGLVLPPGKRTLSVCRLLQSLALMALVFAVGFSLGARPGFFGDVLSYGGAGFAFALASAAGSVLTAHLARLWFSEKGGEGK